MEDENMQNMVQPLPIPAAPVDSQAKRRLMTFLTEQTAPLLGSIRSYVQRMGLARGQAVSAVALEILQEVVVEALDHIDRFDPTRQPMAWLLGIAINVIKRKKVEAAKQYRREVTFGRLALLLPGSQNDDELFDLITPFTLDDPEQDVAANEQASLILSLVSPEDQRILRLAVLHDFARDALAETLGITPVAARVRLHRALNRLRSAWGELQIRQQQAQSVEAVERKKP